MLLSNYFENYKYEKTNDFYTIKSGNSSNYYVKETCNGTSIIYGNIVNGSRYMIELSNYIDYAILDEKFIEHELFLKILSLYKNLLTDSNNNYLEKIEELIGNDTSFFDKKTIYKVKRNEKN